MAKSLVTPEDLRHFADILNKNVEELTSIESAMDNKLYNYDWRDVVATRFKGQYEDAKASLNRLRQAMKKFSPYLQDKAVGLEEEYLNV